MPHEIAAEVGFHRANWPVAILKELVDNACDAAEINDAPTVSFHTEHDYRHVRIVVDDNGQGFPVEAVKRLADLTRRTSTKAAFVSLARGSQGNALQYVVAMASLGGDAETGLWIDSLGVRHHLRIITDTVTNEPRLLHTEAPNAWPDGTRMTVVMPRVLGMVDPCWGRERLVFWLWLCNPNFAVNRTRLDGPKAPRWLNDDRPAAAWFTADRFRELCRTMIADGREVGRPANVSELIETFAGLSDRRKASLVLKRHELSRATLESAVLVDDGAGGEVFDDDRLAELLAAIAAEGKVRTRAARLGILGKDAFRAAAAGLYDDGDSKCDPVPEPLVSYCKVEVAEFHALAVVEAAVPMLPDYAQAGSFSAVLINNGAPVPAGAWRFQGLGDWIEDLAPLDSGDAYAVIVHIACPRVSFTDRGKARVVLPDEVMHAIDKAVERVGCPLRDMDDAVRREQEKANRAANAEARAEHKARARHLKAERRTQKQLAKDERRRAAERKRGRMGPVPSISLNFKRLSDRIESEAAKVGCAPSDLFAMTREAEPSAPPTERELRMAWWFAELVDRVDDRTRHLRALFYAALSLEVERFDGKPFTNTNGNHLQDASRFARWLGLVSFGRIIDARNPSPIRQEIDDAPVVITRTSPSTALAPGRFDVSDFGVTMKAPDPFAIALQQQPWHLVIVTEKSSIVPEALPVARGFGGTVIRPTGRISDTLVSAVAAECRKVGKPVVCLYAADFDPSGFDMPRDVGRKLQALHDRGEVPHRVVVVPATLTIQQCEQFDLPSTPLKSKESTKRREAWKASTGRQQTEIDALLGAHPGEVDRILWDAAAPFFDDDLEDAVREALAAQEKACVGEVDAALMVARLGA